MSRFPHLITVSVLLGTLALNHPAQARTEGAPADSAGVVVVPAEAAATAAPATALDREVLAIRATFRTRLAELTTRYHAATDAAATAALQREITALKQGLELDLLDLQLRLARERQDQAAIAELEQTRTFAQQRLVADTGLDGPTAPADGATR